MGMSGLSPPRRYGHYSLPHPVFEDHRHYAESLSEFNAGFSRGNSTSSKFEWEQVLAKSNLPNHYGTNPAAAAEITTDRTCDGGGFSNSSRFGTTLLDRKTVFTEEPEAARNFSPRQRCIDVPGSCGDVNWGSFDRGLQMDEDFGLQKQACFDKLAERGDLFQDGDNSTDASMYRRTKEFGLGHQKDPLTGSYEEHLGDLLYGPGICRGVIATPIGHGRLGVKSTESHVDTLQSSNMRSNPHADLCCSEAKHGDCTYMEDRKRERGNMCKMSGNFYTMPSVGDKYAKPDIVRASTGDRIADSCDECYPGITLKNTRMDNHVSFPLNTCYLPANGPLRLKGLEEEVTGHRITLFKYEEDEKHQRLPAAKNHELERERSEMLPAADHDSCLDRVDGQFKQRLPARDLRREIHKRKDGVADLQWTGEDEQHLFVSKKSRCSLPKDGNAGKSSNEAGCHRIANSDNCVSSLDKSNDIGAGDINKTVGTSLRNISSISSSVNKQEASLKKRLGHSPQNVGATDSSVKKQKHVVKKPMEPSPKKDELCPAVLQNQQKHLVKKPMEPTPKKHELCHAMHQNQKAINVANKIQDVLESPCGAYGQKGEFPKASIIPAKNEQPLAPSPRVKNQTPCKFTNRIPDDHDGAHNQEGDFSKSNSIPSKIEPPHVPTPRVENQTPHMLAKVIQDGPGGTCSEEGNSSNSNAIHAKTAPPHASPPQVENQTPGMISKTNTDDTHSQEGESLKGNTAPKTKPPHGYVLPLHLKNNIPGMFSKRSEDVPHGAHRQERDFLKGSATLVKSEHPHVSSPWVKIQKTGHCIIQDSPDGRRSQQGSSWKGKDTLAKTGHGNVPLPCAKKRKADKIHLVVKNHKSRKLNRAGSRVAGGQKEDSSKVDVAHVKTEPPENSQELKKLVDRLFLKFVKQLNENSAQRRSFIEQGKAGSLKCNICGSKSEEFVDMESLVLHTFTSPTVGCRSVHLGFHKALCLMMGWRSAMTFDSLWICEALPDAEASALKENFIIWPPVAIIHNSSLQNNNPDERMVVTVEMLEAALKEMGFGERTKVGRGRPGNQSIMVVKFNGTMSGLQNAERLHRFYVETKHGRAEFQNITNSNRSTHDQSNSLASKDNILYGYLGVAEDLDKLDFETKKHCVVRSKKEIQNIADAF